MEQRKLLFRAWDKDNKKMSKPFGIIHNQELNSDQHVVTQWIGMEDKHDCPIFEGDLVVSDRHPGLGCVSYTDADFSAFSVIEGSWLASIYYENDGGFEKDRVGTDELSVVGNVFENTNLMNREED